MKLLKSLLFSLLLVSSLVFAEAFPSRTVKIITNMPVGSGPDVIIRAYARELEQLWKVLVIIENRPGASGAVALAHYVDNEFKDTHSLYVGDAVNFTAMPLLYQKENLLTHIKPVASLYETTWVVVTSAKYKTNQEVYDALKNNTYFSSWAVGSPGHLCGQTFTEAVTGTQGTHVTYKEYGQWFTDLANQQAVIACSSFSSTRSFVEGGKLRWIATTSASRDPQHPDVPTIKELLKKDILPTPGGLVAVYVSRSLDNKITKKIEQDIIHVSKYESIKNLLKFHSAVQKPVLNSSQLDAYQKRSTEDYRKFIQKYNISIQ